MVAVGSVAAACTALGFFGAYHWKIDLFAHFRMQYTIVLALVGAILLGCRARGAALFCGLFLLLNLVVIAPYYWPAFDRNEPAQKMLRAVHFNVLTANNRYAEVQAFLQQTNADLILLEEINQTWLTALDLLVAEYPYVVSDPRGDNFGIVLFSRWPFIDSALLDLANTGVPAIVATIDTPQGELHVLGIHTLPPINLAYATVRDRQIAAIPQYLASSEAATMVLGDLNTTPWSAPFRQLIDNSALHDCGTGFGIQPTWPTTNRTLMVPIDHCLRSSHLTISNKVTLRDLGSDHLPNSIDFYFSAAPEAQLR